MIDLVLEGPHWSVHWIDYEPYDAPGRSERREADALLAKGRYQEALAPLERAAKVAANGEELNRRATWVREFIQAKNQPRTLPEALLQSYTGQYGPRRLFLESGRLHYQRGSGKKYALVTLKDNLFALEGLDWFRLELERDEQGLPLKIIGHYANGHQDESPRDPDQVN